MLRIKALLTSLALGGATVATEQAKISFEVKYDFGTIGSGNLQTFPVPKYLSVLSPMESNLRLVNGHFEDSGFRLEGSMDLLEKSIKQQAVVYFGVEDPQSISIVSIKARRPWELKEVPVLAQEKTEE